MSVTQDDLHSFNLFAIEQLRNGEAESIEELLKRWRLAKEREEVNTAIRKGVADVEAGRTRPLDEFWDEFSQRYDIPSDA